jgi:predicted RNA-binding protein Jag
LQLYVAHQHLCIPGKTVYAIEHIRKKISDYLTKIMTEVPAEITVLLARITDPCEKNDVHHSLISSVAVTPFVTSPRRVRPLP